MVTAFKGKGLVILGLTLMALCLMGGLPTAFAQEHVEGEEIPGDPNTEGYGWRVAGLAIGAGIAMAGAGMGTGRAQAGVGAGGTGAMAEKPELFTNVLILFAIPETIVILGFVVAFLLIGQIKV